MSKRPKVVISLIGTSLDNGFKNKRWERWRPSVSICQQEDFAVSRYHLIYNTRFEKLANQVKKDIEQVSPETTVINEQIEFKNPWDFEEVFSNLLDFCESQTFDPENEDYYIHITTGTHVAQICMFLLTEANHFPGRLLQSEPGKSEADKAVGNISIIDLDLSKYDKLATRFERNRCDDLSFLKSGIETRNKTFNRLIERIERVGIASDAPILLTGPTGAGKSFLARRIYELRKHHKKIKGEFVEVNCATLRGDTAMSTLFGHRKGAFTGAQEDREGLLRTANDGIIFLDEIGELGLDEQAMLLRAIEEKSFMPMGADKEVESNFSLICGTNRDLRHRVSEGMFREDLLARINLWQFKMPGLKERPEDIEPNVQYELQQYMRKTGRRITFNKEAYERFLSFATGPMGAWTANFRDLNSAMTRLATLADGGRISGELVEEETERLLCDWELHAEDPHEQLLLEVMDPYAAKQLDLFDKPQLVQVIKTCRESNSIAEAGRKLFAISRQQRQTTNDGDRLRKYLAKFNLTFQQVKC